MSAINRYGYEGKVQPALVFIHGAGMDSTVWASQARYFAARGHEVIGLDLPGHGRSSGQALGSIEEMAEWVCAQLDELGIASAVLVGHSMGSFVALEASANRPDSRVILLGSAASMPVHPALLKAAQEHLPQAAEMIAGWGFIAGIEQRSQALPSQSLTWSARRLLERSKPGVLASDLAACAAYEHARDRAASLDRPMTLIAGAKDRMTPVKGAKELAVGNPGSLKIVPDAGHMMFLEAPAHVRRLIGGAVAG